jgi:hypothetical protein
MNLWHFFLLLFLFWSVFWVCVIARQRQEVAVAALARPVVLVGICLFLKSHWLLRLRAKLAGGQRPVRIFLE